MTFDSSKPWQRWFRRATGLAALVALLFVGIACEAPEDMPDPDALDDEEMVEEPPMTVVDLAEADERFSTLASALEATNLDETLRGPGPFTIFAPTNDAFDELPEGTLDELLEEENHEQLIDILSYHVISGQVMAADAAETESAATIQGADLNFSVDEDGNVMVNDVNIIEVDLMGDNGVIHVIDQVLMPPEE